MKNTIFFLLPSKLALVSFLMAGLFLLAPDKTQAQGNSTLSVPYVSASVAISRLEIETVVLKGQIETLTPGSFDYRKAIWKYGFFDAVLNYLYAGKTVSKSVEDGFLIYVTDPYDDMPESQKKANRNLLIQILEP